MNPTDSLTKPSPTPTDSSIPPESSKKPPDSSNPSRNHQQTIAGIKTFAGITMNPTDSSKNPPDSSTNPSDSSIINDIDENHLIEVHLVTEDSMKSPRPTLYEHSETPGGSVYWVPHVDEGITVPEEGKSYDTIDEAIEMFSNYTEAGGFQIKKAGQKTTKSGIVTLKYLMFNKEGAPRHVKIGNGRSTRFWSDTWVGNSPLSDNFPRLFRIETNPDCRVCD
ncbi:FAR1 DNA binding domain-containing protein [Artemisia annua]|uniref:FAR1 DNA binding domain-containing protein n=1 Tax=Artemisia annua TaxID=35608 RepID=A0A2U1M8Y1_ARTAN|nr:FAR1 DNA binding domain-containing protein [Artemisia annua]